MITDKLDLENSIKIRIKMAKFYCNDTINSKIRQCMIECNFWFVLLYRLETWTLNMSSLNGLEALKM